MTCAHKGCDNTDVDVLEIPLKWATPRKIHAIVRVCESCKDELKGKPIDYTHWQAGNLHFIEEMWASESEVKS